MAQSRYYSSNAEPTVLTSGITNANTVINVMSAVGFPASLPFIIALDYNTASEELALVTGVAGTSWTVTRAYDGTSATSHNVGAEVRHTWAAIDGNDSRAHEGSSTNIHGLAISSAVVGTTDTQTLTNKSLTSPAITGSVTGSATYTGVTDSPTATTNPGLVVKGLAAQSGNLQEWQNNTGTVLGKVTSTGAVSHANMGPSFVENTVGGNVTSTSYVDGPQTVSTTITVPPSGRVFVSANTNMFLNTAAQTFYSTITVSGSTTGSIRAASDTTAMHYASDNTGSQGWTAAAQTFVITSANIGETLTVKFQHRVTGGTGGLDYRNITVLPLVG